MTELPERKGFGPPTQKNFDAIKDRLNDGEDRLTSAEARLDLIEASASTFPTAPSDGDLHVVNADTTNGVKWQFQFRDSANTYEWEFIGGAPLRAYDVDSRALTNQTTYAALPTDPITLTLPAIKGVFDITIQAGVQLGTAGANATYLSYMVDNPTSSDINASDDWAVATGLTATVQRGSMTHRHTIVDASAIIREQGRTSGNFTGTFDKRSIFVHPVCCSN